MTTDYAGDSYRACMQGNADAQQQQSAASQIALLHGIKGELLDALQGAHAVLVLLENEVKGLGCGGERVALKVRLAIAKATKEQQP